MSIQKIIHGLVIIFVVGLFMWVIYPPVMGVLGESLATESTNIWESPAEAEYYWTLDSDDRDTYRQSHFTEGRNQWYDRYERFANLPFIGALIVVVGIFIILLWLMFRESDIDSIQYTQR